MKKLTKYFSLAFLSIGSLQANPQADQCAQFVENEIGMIPVVGRLELPMPGSSATRIISLQADSSLVMWEPSKDRFTQDKITLNAGSNLIGGKDWKLIANEAQTHFAANAEEPIDPQEVDNLRTDDHSVKRSKGWGLLLFRISPDGVKKVKLQHRLGTAKSAFKKSFAFSPARSQLPLLATEVDYKSPDIDARQPVAALQLFHLNGRRYATIVPKTNEFYLEWISEMKFSADGRFLIISGSLTDIPATPVKFKVDLVAKTFTKMR